MQVKRTIIAPIVIGLSLMAFGGSQAIAQDATPEGDAACVTTSVEENVAAAERLYQALSDADGETIDAILADNYTHNADRFGLPDDMASNDDEIQLAMMLSEVYPNSTEVVQDIFGADDKVVVESSRTITEHAFEGESVTLETPIELRTLAVLTFECGQVISMNAMVNTLELMVGLGVVELPEFAPVPES